MNLEIHCSSLARPMVCAGFMSFTNLPEQETTAPAMEGTAAGEYFAHLLQARPPGPQASNGVSFDDDMKFFLVPLAQDIVNRTETEVLCEQKCDWQTRSGIWIRGQSDAVYVSNGKLYVDDLKYGWGLVEVKDNWQVIGYAIGEVIRRNEAFDSIVMRILQPRPHHEDGIIREWEISYSELLELKEKIETRMEQIASGFKELVTGPKCKYCPAAARHCPALNKAFYRGVEVAHEFTEDNIDEKELSFQLDLIARVSEILKIKSDSLQQLAVDRIKNGKVIPNYVSESRYGDRKWKDGVSPESIKMLTGKDILTTEMLSPAKAEKLGVPKAVVAELVDRHFIGAKLTRRDHNELGNKIFGKTE